MPFYTSILLVIIDLLNIQSGYHVNLQCSILKHNELIEFMEKTLNSGHSYVRT